MIEVLKSDHKDRQEIKKEFLNLLRFLKQESLVNGLRLTTITFQAFTKILQTEICLAVKLMKVLLLSSIQDNFKEDIP